MIGAQSTPSSMNAGQVAADLALPMTVIFVGGPKFHLRLLGKKRAKCTCEFVIWGQVLLCAFTSRMSGIEKNRVLNLQGGQSLA